MFYISKSFKYFLLFFLLSTFISACDLTSQKTSKEINKKPFVLTTFTVLADISRNIAGERIQVESITKEGVEIHGYNPTPSDVIKATNADLVIKNGLGLELWANDFIRSAGKVKLVVLTDDMQPLFISEDAYKGKPNPHAWISPIRAIAYVDKILEALIELDPQGEDYYIDNAIKYKNQLRLLDSQLRRKLSTVPQAKKVLVTCEGAFSYLAHDYGMKEAYLWPVNSESQITPRRMLNLIELVKKNNVNSVFCESTVSSKGQLQVASATGASFGGTFYVDSLSDSNGPASTFINLLKHNTYLIQKGFTED